MDKLNAKILSKAQKKVAEYARKRNRALGLTYMEVKGDDLVKIFPDGRIEIVGKALFGLTKISRKRFMLKHEG